MAAKLRDAAARGNTQEVLRLLEEGAKLLPDENGLNALHIASSAGHADVVAALLLTPGCDVNAADSSGCTALQRAAADGHLEVVQQLLKHGADVNRQDHVHGNTALHEASWKGYSRSVAAISKAKANLHLKNCGGFAALHLCCQNGHNQSCRELLLAGCNPDLQNNYGDTPLHTSARYGHAGVTRILISAQCRVSDQNKNGDTALHIAAAMGRRKLTRILLEANCDKHLKNKQNETAKDIATRKDLNEILVILNSTPSKAKSKGNDKKREKQESGTSSKDSSTRHKDKKKAKSGHKVHFEKDLNTKNWSPYGCHYFPDPKAFPQPKLDSLPEDPLHKGEQYYLDLAGNIRKGPVGVGYTCYCAPFFKHMEERLDRDKQELKQHIDQAHERLDQKVSSLERRTRGQLSELTRCVVEERALCDRRHVHLAQWIERGGKARRSERVRGVAESPPPLVSRARSLEMLIDQPDSLARHIENQNLREASRAKDRRSMEVLIDGPDELWQEEQDARDWRKQKHRSSSHEMKRQDAESPHDMPRVKPLINGNHNRSFDALLDRNGWRGHPHRSSVNELSFGKKSESTNNRVSPEHNRSFDGILRNHNVPWEGKPHHKSTNEIPVPSKRTVQHNRSFDILVDKGSNSFIPPFERNGGELNETRLVVNGNVSPTRPHVIPENGDIGEGSHEWRNQPMRRSVHEMVARIQSQQSTTEPDQRLRQLKPSAIDKEPVNNMNGDSWAKDYRRSGWGRQKSHDEAISESSGDEENPENVIVSELPYRSRIAVYSPDCTPDVHNDSGYSTKLYGSSKGPSPSLSGQMECDANGIQTIINSNMTEVPPRRPPLPRARNLENSQVITASLV